jgi:hypothetical protein
VWVEEKFEEAEGLSLILEVSSSSESTEETSESESEFESGSEFESESESGLVDPEEEPDEDDPDEIEVAREVRPERLRFFLSDEPDLESELTSTSASESAPASDSSDASRFFRCNEQSQRESIQREREGV